MLISNIILTILLRFHFGVLSVGSCVQLLMVLHNGGIRHKLVGILWVDTRSVLWLELGRAVLGVLVSACRVVAHRFVHHQANIPLIIFHHHLNLLVHIALVLLLLHILFILLEAHFDVIMQFLTFLIRQLIQVKFKLLIIIVL